MCESISAKVCLAQSIADRTGVPQALVANVIGGLSISPAVKVPVDETLMVFMRRTDPEQLSDKQCDDLRTLHNQIKGAQVNDSIRAVYALGYQTAHKAQQERIDSLLTERAELLAKLDALKLMLADAQQELSGE